MSSDDDERPRSAALRVARVGIGVVVVLLAIQLLLTAAAPVDEAPGRLVSVDNVGRTSVQVTVAYDGPDGRPRTSQVSLLRGQPDLRPGSTITIYLRDGVAVDEPPPLLAALVVTVAGAAVVWWALDSLVRWIARPDRVRRKADGL